MTGKKGGNKRGRDPVDRLDAALPTENVRARDIGDLFEQMVVWFEQLNVATIGPVEWAALAVRMLGLIGRITARITGNPPPGPGGV
jgi:hypothetical protein